MITTKKNKSQHKKYNKIKFTKKRKINNKHKHLYNNKKNSNTKNTHRRYMLIGGNDELGPYLARLTNKPPDEPITSGELKQALQEIIEIMNQVKYTEEGRQFSVGTNLLQYFTGDEQAMESYLRYQVMPKYVRIFPPYINIKGLFNKIYEISFFANAYLADQRFRNATSTNIDGSPSNVGDKQHMTFAAEMLSKLSEATTKFNLKPRYRIK